LILCNEKKVAVQDLKKAMVKQKDEVSVKVVESLKKFDELS
jgi:hypothetical protein